MIAWSWPISLESVAESVAHTALRLWISWKHCAVLLRFAIAVAYAESRDALALS